MCSRSAAYAGLLEEAPADFSEQESRRQKYIYMVLFDLYYWNPGYLSRSWGATKNSTHDVSQTTVSSVLMDHGCCSCRPCWSEGWQLGHWKDQKRLVEYHCSTTLQRHFSSWWVGLRPAMSLSQARETHQPLTCACCIISILCIPTVSMMKPHLVIPEIKITGTFRVSRLALVGTQNAWSSKCC